MIYYKQVYFNQNVNVGCVYLYSLSRDLQGERKTYSNQMGYGTVGALNITEPTTRVKFELLPHLKFTWTLSSYAIWKIHRKFPFLLVSGLIILLLGCQTW